MNKFELLEIFGFGRPFQKDEAAIGWRCRYGDKLFGDFIHISKPDFEDPEILVYAINELLKQFAHVMNKLEEEQMDSGCEFCDNGDHLTLSDKHGHRVHCTYCPSCGRRVD